MHSYSKLEACNHCNVWVLAMNLKTQNLKTSTLKSQESISTHMLTTNNSIIKIQIRTKNKTKQKGKKKQFFRKYSTKTRPTTQIQTSKTIISLGSKKYHKRRAFFWGKKQGACDDLQQEGSNDESENQNTGRNLGKGLDWRASRMAIPRGRHWNQKPRPRTRRDSLFALLTSHSPNSQVLHFPLFILFLFYFYQLLPIIK